jgi:hypothetical protein
MKRHPLYGVWVRMKMRCQNPKCDRYRWYGAKGVTVCDRWNISFVDFLTDVGERPSSKHSLDRIDGSKGYEPGNVRWATKATQASNMSSNLYYTYQGQTLTQAQWARKAGLTVQTLNARLVKQGLTIEQALTTPLQHGRRRMVLSTLT